jgi:hypothetical protein
MSSTSTSTSIPIQAPRYFLEQNKVDQYIYLLRECYSYGPGVNLLTGDYDPTYRVPGNTKLTSSSHHYFKLHEFRDLKLTPYSSIIEATLTNESNSVGLFEGTNNIIITDRIFVTNIYKDCQDFIQKNEFITQKQQQEDLKNLIKNNSFLFQFINENLTVTPELRLAAVSSDTRTYYNSPLEFISEPFQTLEICLASVKQSSNALQYVKKQTPEICLASVKHHGTSIQYVNSVFLTQEIKTIAVTQDGRSLEYISEQDQTPELCIIAISHSAFNLKFCVNPTHEVYLAAVTKDGLQLKNIENENQTYDICLAAIRQNVYAYTEIKDKSFILSNHMLTLEAVKLGLSFAQVIRQTDDICLEAVKNNWYQLYWVKHQTQEMRDIALKQDARAAKYFYSNFYNRYRMFYMNYNNVFYHTLMGAGCGLLVGGLYNAIYAIYSKM